MKKNYVNLICLFIMFASFSVCASENSIQELANFQHITNLVDSNAVIVLDLDNTVMEIEQSLGGDQWFGYYFNKKLTEEKNPKIALEKTLQLYRTIQRKSLVKLVEPSTALQIQQWQQKGYPVFALTTRGSQLGKTTLRQLASLNIDFNRGKFLNFSFVGKPDKKDRVLKVDSGVIFADGQDKGQCLEQIFSALNWRPKKVIFVDDKEKNVLSVARAMQKLDIPYVGLRYNYLDEKVKQFNVRLAEIQLRYFEKPLSDQGAMAILESSNYEFTG